MTISDRIKSLGNFFKEMQITNINNQQVIYVVVNFPNGWMIDDEIYDKYKVQVQEGTNRGEYYFCADIETGENAIFDAIEYNVNKMKSAIERANLLRAKIEELKRIFEDESVTLDQLRDLKFTFPEKSDIASLEDVLDEESLPISNFLTGINEKNKNNNKKGGKKNAGNNIPEDSENIKNDAL